MKTRNNDQLTREDSIVKIVPYTSWNTLDSFFPTHFDDLFNRMSLRESVRSWVPAVDIEEDPNEVVLTMDVPGVANDDIEILLEDGVLTIKGSRSLERKDTARESGGLNRFERVSGSFERNLKLPITATENDVSAHAKEGILTIKVKKPEVEKPKRITVTA